MTLFPCDVKITRYYTANDWSCEVQLYCPQAGSDSDTGWDEGAIAGHRHAALGRLGHAAIDVPI